MSIQFNSNKNWKIFASKIKSNSDNLLIDATTTDISTQALKIYNSINALGQKTLANTMQNINNFFSNEIK